MKINKKESMKPTSKWFSISKKKKYKLFIYQLQQHINIILTSVLWLNRISCSKHFDINTGFAFCVLPSLRVNENSQYYLNAYFIVNFKWAI